MVLYVVTSILEELIISIFSIDMIARVLIRVQCKSAFMLKDTREEGWVNQDEATISVTDRKEVTLVEITG